MSEDETHRTAGTSETAPDPLAVLAHLGIRDVKAVVAIQGGWAFIARDLQPKAGQPGIWLRPDHLGWMRHQATIWKRRAGIKT